MSDLLLKKAYNCYMVFLDNLNYGKVSQNYCLLYDAVLMIANNIEDKQFLQYFENNLGCGNLYPLNITQDMNRKILWTLNESASVLNTFSWNEINVPRNGMYTFTTNRLGGFNYLYVSIPQSVNFLIYNELGVQIFDSLINQDSQNQLFQLVGTATVSGNINNIYKKKNVFNTSNQVLFKVQIY